MTLPKSMRARVPDRVRDDPRLRAVALAAGLIPPRTMHSAEEAAVLARIATGRRLVVELGVYEGSSALVLCRSMRDGAELHLIDPFVDESGWALPPGFGARPSATRRVLARAAGGGDAPKVVWHVARSQDVGGSWTGGEVDFVFIDGDHSPGGCREDWDVWHQHVGSHGFVAFHDARLGQPSGLGSPGPTAVVDELFRGAPPVPWAISEEVDSLVVVQRGS